MLAEPACSPTSRVLVAEDSAIAIETAEGLVVITGCGHAGVVNTVQYARKSLAMGGGRRPDSTQVVLGMALYNLERYDEARAAFTEAGRDPRSEQVATQWLHFLQTEIARAAQLAEEVQVR